MGGVKLNTIQVNGMKFGKNEIMKLGMQCHNLSEIVKVFEKAIEEIVKKSDEKHAAMIMEELNNARPAEK